MCWPGGADCGMGDASCWPTLFGGTAGLVSSHGEWTCLFHPKGGEGLEGWGGGVAAALLAARVGQRGGTGQANCERSGGAKVLEVPCAHRFPPEAPVFLSACGFLACARRQPPPPLFHPGGGHGPQERPITRAHATRLSAPDCKSSLLSSVNKRAKGGAAACQEGASPCAATGPGAGTDGMLQHFTDDRCNVCEKH